MLVCKDPVFYYLPFPKTATATIWQVLQQFFEVEQYPGEGDKHKMKADPGLQDAYIFASVRCPYSRAVSWYSHLRHKETYPHSTDVRKKAQQKALNLDLAAFLWDPWVTGYARLGSSGMLNWPVAHMIKYERLREGITELPFMVDKVFTMPHLHNSEREEPWYVVYQENPGLAEHVYQAHKEDFERWDYSPDLCEYIS